MKDLFMLFKGEQRKGEKTEQECSNETLKGIQELNEMPQAVNETKLQNETVADVPQKEQKCSERCKYCNALPCFLFQWHYPIL